MNKELISQKEKYYKIRISLEKNIENLSSKIKEGNDIETDFDKIKKERNLLIEQLFVNPPNNNKIIHSEVNEDENDE